VAQELRNQWSDEDLRRRDQTGCQSSWWVDDENLSELEESDAALVSMEELTAKGQALMAAAQEEVDLAMAPANIA
jgi:hypothetical protein